MLHVHVRDVAMSRLSTVPRSSDELRDELRCRFVCWLFASHGVRLLLYQVRPSPRDTWLGGPRRSPGHANKL